MGNQKKTYYVDGHEHPEQLKHRDWFTKEYLTKIEPRSHRWVQITEEQYKCLREMEDLLNEGYQYRSDDDNRPMREFHVDDHEKLQEIANKFEFGGKYVR